MRAQTGMQDFVASAPLTLVYVADGGRLEGATGEDKRFWAFTDTGFIGQNVYLFCASEGLAAVFRGSLRPRATGANAATAHREIHHLCADGRVSQGLRAGRRPIRRQPRTEARPIAMRGSE